MSRTTSAGPSVLRRLRGFTLLEGAVTISIVAVIGLVLTQAWQGGIRNYVFGAEVADEDAKGRILLERVTRDFRMVRSANDIGTFSATQFTYTDTTGAFVNYQYSAGSRSLTRQQNAGTARTLADTISGLTFSYMQSDGVTAAGSASAIAFIQISATISSSNTTAVYRATVSPLGY